MDELYDHIFLNDWSESLSYTSHKQRGAEPRIPQRNRILHSQRLINTFQTIWEQVKERTQERGAVSLSSRDGTYLEFSSQTGNDLITKSLEDIRQGVRLLNIRQTGEGETQKTLATVYVPAGKESHFISKVEKYRDKDRISGKPWNEPLVNSIEDVKLAFLDALWTDSPDLIPQNNPTWCEVWLRFSTNEEEVVGSFVETLESIEILYKSGYILFPERAVLLIYANNEQLAELVSQSDYVAEFRIGQEAASFWVNESHKDQQGWVHDLLDRLEILDTNISICILDSGVNNGHKLLQPILEDKNCLTVNPAWGTDDHESGSGHGTLIGGLAAYNKLEEVLASKEDIVLTHKLCSVKILPRPNQEATPVELWGDITDQAISRATINQPEERFVFCMSVTSNTDVDKGRPSSWSGAIDKTSFGSDKEKKLIIVSAGNIKDYSDWNAYPESNLTKSVQNPAQAWNALAVGAYTDKVLVSDPSYHGYTPLAPVGGLSPFSSTSFIWEKTKWPIKPDVVFEGGNILKAPDGQLDEGYDDYGLLSTSKNIQFREFDIINATSAATAQASWFAAKIANEYKDLWPETIRALMVHSATWTQDMISQFNINLSSKGDVKQLLRICGYGIPILDKALYTTQSGLTFVVEEYIQPFEKKGSTYATNEMHFYELPWPKEELLANPDIRVKVKITLSYFIEPGPGEVGWRDKYRYRSHGLCFDLNSETETEGEFKKRINAAAKEDDEELVNDSGSERWLIGMNGRKLGSIHSDIWEGTAAQVASCNMISVYPIIGWWRQRTHLKKWDSRTRYSLVVSLETPATEVDLYTPVMNKIKTPITIKSEK